MLPRTRNLLTAAILACAALCCVAQSKHVSRETAPCAIRRPVQTVGVQLRFSRDSRRRFSPGNASRSPPWCGIRLRTSLDGKRVLVASPHELLTNYDRIFDASVRCAIHQASAADVWGRDQGFTFNDGAIWWDIVVPKGATIPQSQAEWAKLPMKIIAVNNATTHPGCGSAK